MALARERQRVDAEQLSRQLKNGLLRELFEEFRTEQYEAWQSAPTPEARERLHVFHEAATRIEELIGAKCQPLEAGDGAEQTHQGGGDASSNGRPKQSAAERGWRIGRES